MITVRNRVFAAGIILSSVSILHANGSDSDTGAVAVSKSPSGFITTITIDEAQLDSLGDDLQQYFDLQSSLELISVKNVTKGKEFFFQYVPGAFETDESGMPLPGSLPRKIKVNFVVLRTKEKKLRLKTFVATKDYFLLKNHGIRIYQFLADKRKERREKALHSYSNDFSIPLNIYKTAVDNIYGTEKELSSTAGSEFTAGSNDT